MFGNRRHFRELLTRSEERIASNIPADRLTRLEKAGLVSRRDDPSHKQKVIISGAAWSGRPGELNFRHCPLKG
jgi:DNA-binding HxlR family transcriptional regulator